MEKTMMAIEENSINQVAKASHILRCTIEKMESLMDDEET